MFLKMAFVPPIRPHWYGQIAWWEYGTNIYIEPTLPKKKNSINILTIIGYLFIAGCYIKNHNVDCRELYGVYLADSGSYPDIVEIREDGTYVHTYFLYPQDQRVSTNKWSCTTKEGKTIITFENWLFGVDFVTNSEKQYREWPGF